MSPEVPLHSMWVVHWPAAQNTHEALSYLGDQTDLWYHSDFVQWLLFHKSLFLGAKWCCWLSSVQNGNGRIRKQTRCMLKLLRYIMRNLSVNWEKRQTEFMLVLPLFLKVPKLLPHDTWLHALNCRIQFIHAFVGSLGILAGMMEVTVSLKLVLCDFELEF